MCVYKPNRLYILEINKKYICIIVLHNFEDKTTNKMVTRTKCLVFRHMKLNKLQFETFYTIFENFFITKF